MKNLSSKQSVTMILIVITSLFWIEPRAEADLDSATRSALEQTQKVLRDPSTRGKILDSDSTARQNDSKLLQITGGGANQQEIYEIAAVIFESLLSETTGEPAEVEKILNDAMKDPTKFYEKLKPSDQARIKKLADKIQSSQTRKPH